MGWNRTKSKSLREDQDSRPVWAVVRQQLVLVMMTSQNDMTPGPCRYPGLYRLDAQPTSRGYEVFRLTVAD